MPEVQWRIRRDGWTETHQHVLSGGDHACPEHLGLRRNLPTLAQPPPKRGGEGGCHPGANALSDCGTGVHLRLAGKESGSPGHIEGVTRAGPVNLHLALPVCLHLQHPGREGYGVRVAAESLCRARSGCQSLVRSATMDPLRSDPRFVSLLQRMNFTSRLKVMCDGVSLQQQSLISNCHISLAKWSRLRAPSRSSGYVPHLVATGRFWAHGSRRKLWQSTRKTGGVQRTHIQSQLVFQSGFRV